MNKIKWGEPSFNASIYLGFILHSMKVTSDPTWESFKDKLKDLYGK